MLLLPEGFMHPNGHLPACEWAFGDANPPDHACAALRGSRLHARLPGGGDGVDLWDEQDKFYYDVLHLPGAGCEFLRVRSLVGLIPLLAVETMDAEVLNVLPGFRTRLEWFLKNRPDLCSQVASVMQVGESN